MSVLLSECNTLYVLLCFMDLCAFVVCRFVRLRKATGIDKVLWKLACPNVSFQYLNANCLRLAKYLYDGRAHMSARGALPCMLLATDVSRGATTNACCGRSVIRACKLCMHAFICVLAHSSFMCRCFRSLSHYRFLVLSVLFHVYLHVCIL